MIALTQEKREELIRYAKFTSAQYDHDEELCEIMEIALASLTAVPFGWEIAGHIFPTLEEALKPGYIGTPEPIYDEPPVPEIIDIESDVKNIIQLLSGREWAEHCTSTELGKELESQITDLYNEVSKIKLPKIVSRSEIAGNEASRDWFLRGCDWYEKEIKALYGLGE